MECVVFMGAEDMKRQATNVKRMEMLGAEVHCVSSGTATLKDAMSEALRAWIATVENTFYVIGSTAGPHPYPSIVRHFQAVIGREARQQALRQAGKLPGMVLACVGGGSNAAGIFSAFLDDRSVKLIGVEAAGEGLKSGRHAASICAGRTGILHGNKTFLLQDADGQISSAHSIAAGLDYPGVGPQHACWADTGRVKYCSVTDSEAVRAFHHLTALEGIIPALESAHALAEAMKRARKSKKSEVLVVCLSGRGDKDMDSILEYDANKKAGIRQGKP
jgi:tryptophan synthase beta chain